MDRSQNTFPSPGAQDDPSHDKPQKPGLTKEELEALQACNRESFWYRCVPAGIVLIGTTQLLVSKGYLQPHPRYGALLKNMGAALVAYIGGKVSYQDTCREKIMRLENSPLAESMRKGKRGTEILQEMSVPSAGYSGSNVDPRVPEAAQKVKMQEDYSARDIDMDSNTHQKGLDDTFRPSVDGTGQKLPSSSEEKQYTSYDELRKKNRIEYEQKLFAPKSSSQDPEQTFPKAAPLTASDTFSTAVTDQQALPRHRTPEKSSESEKKPKYVRRNQYGDIIED